ncbi:MAG: class I SAM-dependent methyltransferase [Betaproteobacteria bacterium]|nr:class I SAM-dependent methyltransferase [Betaproteobacteria bacterium]
MLQSRTKSLLERRLCALDPPLAVKLWDGTTFAPAGPARVSVTLRNPGALRALLNPSMGELAKCYAEQQVDVEGDARDVVGMAEALCNAGSSVRGGQRVLRKFLRHTRLFDRTAIQRHYDVGDEFFALWLDSRRVYSCAYFRRADDTLDIAQAQKLDHMCRKLQLKPGERFLDIGCGWGALVTWAAQNYGVHATGITLSRNQHVHAQRMIEELGLEGRCRVDLLDYRDLPEHDLFDKIASVGMFEHVGGRNLPLYFGKMFRLLKPGGLALNHGITLNLLDQDELGSGIGQFVDDYVFPGGELVHVSRVIEEMAAQGLECWDVESLRPHYANTLWHWVERLEAKRDAAVALVGEKLYRIWRIYMAGSAHAFERGWMSVFQVLAGKPLANGALGLPLTREYIYGD